VGQHSQHCYHCPPCSSVAAEGCRLRPSPDKSIYLSCISGRRRDGADENFWDKHDCDKVREEGGEGRENMQEWCPWLFLSQPPNIYADSPPLLDGEEAITDDEAESKEVPQRAPPKD
jgi:hypothetical protein